MGAPQLSVVHCLKRYRLTGSSMNLQAPQKLRIISPFSDGQATQRAPVEIVRTSHTPRTDLFFPPGITNFQFTKPYAPHFQ